MILKNLLPKKITQYVISSQRESRKEWIEVVLKYHAKYNKNNTQYKLWQSSNQPKMIIHPKYTKQKVNYIHNNPVVSNIVECPEHYLYSSARNYCNLTPTLLDIEVIDFGVEEGYIML